MPTVLVTGATGQQGGGVIDALLTLQDPNLQIRALTRRPNSATAKALAARGVQTVQGDLQSGEGISAALIGCDAAHLVTDFRGPEDVPGEIRQGKIFVDKAKEVGLKHLVFSSVAGADIAQPVEHFYSKFQIEEHIRESGLSWTVVRPCGFLEVIPPPGLPRALMLGAFAATMGSGSHPYVSCVDIGKMIARALLEPDKFSGKIVNLAGQRATVDELQDALARGAGTRSWRIWVPRWLVLLLSPYHYRQMFKWLGSVVQPGDPEECRQILGSVLSIEDWSKKQAAADAELVRKNK